MQVGTDSYVTVAEADNYIATHYTSTNPARLRWSSMRESDKSIVLVEACAEIEALQFQGRKSEIDQPMLFPRLPFQLYGDTGAPDKIKFAQIELALWLSDDEKQSDISQRRDLQSQGVQSFSIGDLSENYTQGAGEKPAPLLCPKVKSLLSPYLNGGYLTC